MKSLINQELSWYNFRTDQYELIDTPQDFSDYIPQFPAAQSLYKFYQEIYGDDPISAAQRVLEICVETK